MRLGNVQQSGVDLAGLRRRIARLERVVKRITDAQNAVQPFGVDAVDGHLPGGGLRLSCLHEVAAYGLEVEHGAAASLFVASMAARLQGMVLWVIEQRDLFAPGLAAVGLHPDRLIIAEAGKSVLLVMEEGLRHRGLAAVVGEVHGRLNLTASRRLQLAAEAGGVTGFALRRARKHDDPFLAEPNAAATRWRISALPSAAAIAHAPAVPGLGRARWQVDLLRCRGGGPSTWIMEACDAAGRFGVAEAVQDRSPNSLPEPYRKRHGKGHQAAG